MAQKREQELKKREDELSSEVASLQGTLVREVSSLQTTLEKKTQEVDKLHTKELQLESELSTLRSKAQALENEVARLRGREGDVGSEVLALRNHLEELTKQRAEDQLELDKLREIKEDKDSQTRQESQRKDRLVSLLRQGWPILKHGRQGKPKSRVLYLEDNDKTLVCRDPEVQGKEVHMPLAGLQVSLIEGTKGEGKEGEGLTAKPLSWLVGNRR